VRAARDPGTVGSAQGSDPAIITTQYAKAGDVHIAYQVVGNGPMDLVMVPGFISHIECYWEDADHRASDG
jgi:hypothetical protein